MLIVLKIYNTLTKRLETFSSVKEGKVTMYVCGPTVYDYSHIGHARTYVAFDVIRRYLRLRGYDVFYVQNITDIDDKIINRANSEGVDWKEIVDIYTKDYMEALNKLNIKVDLHPRVSQHIKEIIEFIQLLIDKGYAYVAPSGSVYFEVDKYEDYGRLSGRRDKQLWSQETFAKEKKKPYDFALWKAAKPGEPWWDSPWGAGRPGWHIECSVMASKYLGQQLDIHGGGTDLIFPHHENERAQSEAAFDVNPWVKYWMHTGMLTIKEEKMSKSLGNIISLREAFKKWKPEVIRLWLASAHYRTILSFSEEALNQATQNYDRLVTTVYTLKKLLKEAETSYSLSSKSMHVLKILDNIRHGFYAAMDDDFNASKAFSYVYELTNVVFKYIVSNPEYTVILKAFMLLKEFNQVLGVLDRHFAEAFGEINVSALIDLIVEVRSILRKRKDYELSDWIRDNLQKLGVKLLDDKDKTTWLLT